LFVIDLHSIIDTPCHLIHILQNYDEPAGAEDSSSAGNFVQTDRRYDWPPQNDRGGVKRQTISGKEIPHEKAKKPFQGKGISAVLENFKGFYQTWMRGYCHLYFQAKRKTLGDNGRHSFPSQISLSRTDQNGF